MSKRTPRKLTGRGKRPNIKKIKQIKLSRRMYSAYLKQLQSDITALTLFMKTEGLKLLLSDEDHKTERLESFFDKARDRLESYLIDKAQALFEKALQVVINKVNKVYIEAGFSVLHHSARTLDVIESILDSNLNLIKSITSDIIESYRTTLLQAVGGFDRGSIVRILTTHTRVNQRRAELIARDQTAKALEAYSRSRAMDLGFQYYVWKTVRDERVSTGAGGHEYLDTRIYSYENPTAIIDSYGTKGHPGQRVNCRCSSQSIYLKRDQKVRLIKDKKRGDYYEIIT